MFLKRCIALAVGVLLFIAAFIIYFDVSHAQMEDRFRAEREKFHVEAVVLTAPEPPTPSATPPPVAASSSADTNTLIGPVPPHANASTPDSTTNAPASDTNSAPATPSAPSTMNESRPGSPFFRLASYRPTESAKFQMAADTGSMETPSAPAVPATNTPSVTPSTNAPAPTPQPVAPAPVSAPATTKSLPPEIESISVQPAVGESSVIVLLYHQFVPAGVHIAPRLQWTMNQDIFEAEMKYIHDNGYHVVPLSDVLRFIKHEITLPPGSVAITIDDGYKSAIVYAEPILKKYGYPWTFFVYPAFITVNEGSRAASWNDLLALQAEGVDIESHSMTHPQLTRKGNKTPEQYAAWLNNETAGSKALLEKKMGKTINCFAYPFGDYNKQVEAATIAAGYEAIFTVADNPVHSTTSLHSIGRYTITQSVEKNFAAYLRQSALSLTKADPEPGATTSNPRPVITAVLSTLGDAHLDPKTLETSVRDFGAVRHDFDSQTNTVRLYLPRDLIQQVVLVNIRGRDLATGQVMVANWHFNYEAGTNAATPVHSPIAPSSNAPASGLAPTNAAAASEPEPMEKSAVGTPLDTKPPATH